MKVDLTREEMRIILGWNDIVEQESLCSNEDIILCKKLEDILIEDIKKNDKNNVLA